MWAGLSPCKAFSTPHSGCAVVDMELAAPEVIAQQYQLKRYPLVEMCDMQAAVPIV